MSRERAWKCNRSMLQCTFMVTDAQEDVRDTYEAFKARKHRQFKCQYGGRPHNTQQKLLRVHLRHFLLTMGPQLDGDQLQSEDCIDSGKDRLDQAFLSEQKRLAVAREVIRAERQRAARILQRFLAQRLAMRVRDEKELPSTSEFVAVQRERKTAVLPDARPIASKTVDVAPPNALPRTALPPYEVVVQVVAARDLALRFPVSGHSGDRFIEVELMLKGKAGEMAGMVSPKQFLESSLDGDVQWQDFTLRFAHDPSDIAGVTPDRVVDEWSAAIVVNITGRGGIEATLGVVEIPLSLLDTPLATQYALCRWFPLEKAYAGHTTRGELRVSVCYLMRQATSDEGEVYDTMVPFVNNICSQAGQEENQQRQERKKSIVSRKARASAISSRKALGQSFQQKRASSTTTDVSKKPKPPVLSLKHSMASPIGRISRAEALSPPPSPSSVTSSETSESTPAVDGLASPLQTKSERRIFLPKRQQKYSKPTKILPPKNDQVAKEDPDLQQAPAKSAPSFLKRKPYKVVFKKLDWSGVTSKTDSNLATSSRRADIGRPPRSLNLSQPATNSVCSSRRPGKSAKAATGTHNTKEGSDFASDSSLSGGFIDADTTQQPTALETAIYERCSVTRETASLARFKYQKERKQFVAALQEQAQDRANGKPEPDTDQHLGQESGDHQVFTVSDSTVTELWKKLTGDSSGQLYASMLRRFTDKQSVATTEVIEANVTN